MFDQSIVAKALVFFNLISVLFLAMSGILPNEAYAYAQVAGVQPGPGMYWTSVMLVTALCTVWQITQFRQRLSKLSEDIGRLVMNHGWRFCVSVILGTYAMLIGIAVRPSYMELGDMLLPFWGAVAIVTAYIWFSWILWADGHLRSVACSAADSIKSFFGSVRHTLIEIVHDLDERTERIQYFITKCFNDLQGVSAYLMRVHGRNIAILSVVTTAIMIAMSPVLFPGEAALRTLIFWVTTTLVSATTVATWIIYTEMYPEESEVTDPSLATAVAAEIAHKDTTEESELSLEDEETELDATVKTRAVA